MTEFQLADIPTGRVQAAVKALLDLDDIRDVIRVEIDPNAITAEVYAKDDKGNPFVSDNDLATHTLSRRVVR